MGLVDPESNPWHEPTTQPFVSWERGGVNLTFPNQALITLLFLVATKDPLPCNTVVPIPLHGALALLPHAHQHMPPHSKHRCMRNYQKVPSHAALLLPVVLSQGTCPLCLVLREGWGLAGQLEEWERQ